MRSGSMRLFALSDLHVDFAANLDLVEGLSREEHGADGLIVAGDASHRTDRAERALAALRECFAEVWFTPGNHDLWVDDGTGEPAESSLDRIAAFEALCARLGVRTGPAPAGARWVVPLAGWYEPAFAQRRHADAPSERISRRWADHQRCRWPAGWDDDGERSRRLAEPNEAAIASIPTGCQVVTFSHFLPRPELLPTVAHLRFKELPRVAGSDILEGQLRAAGATVHVFGHTHIPWDEVIDGVRYVQNPLSYPHERKRRGQAGLKLVEV
jgi:predicted phosphodiesterase